METSWTQTLIYPVITGLILLVVEYFVIQPWLRYRESKSLAFRDSDTTTNSHKWGDGIKSGIRQFKQHTNYYNWGGVSIKQHFIELLGFQISKGQAEIFLTVNVRYLLDRQRPIGEYRIVIDRIGDISQLEPLAIRKNPFENQNLPFPGSWLAAGFLLLIVLGCRWFASLPSGFIVTSETGNRTPAPVAEWNNLAIPIALNTSINGTVGGSDMDVYAFKTDLNGKVNITVTPIESFESLLSIYDEHGFQIGTKFIGKVKGSIYIAPESNVSYLIVISPYKGGSYVLSISSSSP